MVDVDLFQCWRVGKTVFTAWLLPLGIIAKFAVLRRSTAMSVRASIATDAAMNLATWTVLIGVPLPVLAWVAAHKLFLDRMVEIERADPFSWIAVLLLAAALAGSVDFAVLRLGFRQRLGHGGLWAFVMVNLLSLTVAGYFTALYILRLPPSPTTFR